MCIDYSPPLESRSYNRKWEKIALFSSIGLETIEWTDSIGWMNDVYQASFLIHPRNDKFNQPRCIFYWASKNLTCHRRLYFIARDYLKKAMIFWSQSSERFVLKSASSLVGCQIVGEKSLGKDHPFSQNEKVIVFKVNPIRVRRSRGKMRTNSLPMMSFASDKLSTSAFQF